MSKVDNSSTRELSKESIVDKKKQATELLNLIKQRKEITQHLNIRLNSKTTVSIELGPEEMTAELMNKRIITTLTNFLNHLDQQSKDYLEELKQLVS